MSLQIKEEGFWDQAELSKELERVFDICNGCRRCYNLCPSFSALFRALDRDDIDGDAALLTAVDRDQVIQLCYQCKLCYNHCPYTPPHRWQVDFPRLMLRAKAVQARCRGMPFQDRMSVDQDLIGSIGVMFWPLSNWALKLRPVRVLMEKITGIHRDRLLPEYPQETFSAWFKLRKVASFKPKRKAVLFYTCSVNYSQIDVGKAAVEVLERNGIEVVCPKQRCCGMPYLDVGDIDSALEKIRFNVESLSSHVSNDSNIVVLGPTCSYMLKQEYPLLCDDAASKRLASLTYDICEYLVRLHKEDGLNASFVRPVGKIAYHLPCHLKAQNIGYKSMDLLKLIPGADVRLIEHCAGIDGTWGLRRQHYDLSFKVADKLLKGIEQAGADLIVSDCPLASVQIRQGTGKKPLHPIQVLRMAYGGDPK